MAIRTIIHTQYWSILQLFYTNHNSPLHLRDICRKINLRESATSRHLQALERVNILKSHKDANLKKYSIKKQAIPELFSLFDRDKLEALPLLRKNAIAFYIDALKEKPIFIILFGSTAKRTFRDDSDIDLITVFNKKKNTGDAIKYAEAQTGIRVNEFQLTYTEFVQELKLKQDNVIQAGIETGYPVYNQLYFEEIRNNG